MDYTERASIEHLDAGELLSEAEFEDVQDIIYEVIEWCLERYEVVVKHYLYGKSLKEGMTVKVKNYTGITITNGQKRIDITVFYKHYGDSDLDFFAEVDIVKNNRVVNYINFSHMAKLKRYIGSIFRKT